MAVFTIILLSVFFLHVPSLKSKRLKNTKLQFELLFFTFMKIDFSH